MTQDTLYESNFEITEDPCEIIVDQFGIKLVSETLFLDGWLILDWESARRLRDELNRALDVSV